MLPNEQVKKSKVKKVILIVIVLVLIGLGIYSQRGLLKRDNTNTEQIDWEAKAKAEWQLERKESVEFKQMIQDELDRQWYEKMKQESTDKLKELEQTGFLTPDRKMAIVKKANGTV